MLFNYTMIPLTPLQKYTIAQIDAATQLPTVLCDLIAHYAHPQDFVPGSIMPEFPFSNSERAALSQYDLSLKPTSEGARQVSPDEDMPEGDLKARGAQTATAGYMVR